MGNIQSVDPAHVRIYNNLLQIKSLAKRQEMLETLMNGNEYIISLKRTGIYGDVLTYMGSLRSGKVPSAPLPGEQIASTRQTAQTGHRTNQQQQQQQQQQRLHQQNQLVVGQTQAQKDPHKVVGKQKNSQKALSFFTTCLRVLDLALRHRVAARGGSEDARGGLQGRHGPHRGG